MAIDFPLAIAAIAPIPQTRGFCEAPPIVWSSLAEQWKNESGTAISGARYAKQHGEVQGAETPKPQDTYAVGTAQMTGRAFKIVKGQWSSLFHKTHHCYGMLYDNGAPSTGPTDTAEIVSNDTRDDIEHAQFVINRGEPPVVSSGSQDDTRKAANNYLYLHLAYQSSDNMDYRLYMPYGQPPRLDITYDGGNTWDMGVGAPSDLAALQKYSANNPELTITIRTSGNYKVLSVEIGDGNYIVHTPDKTRCNPPKNITSFQDSDRLLPRNGKIRLVSRNAWVAFWYLPLRYDNITVSKSPRDFGVIHPNAQNAYVISNGLTTPNPAQTENVSIQTDGRKHSYSITTTMPDAGDGRGSSDPARLGGADFCIDAVWDTKVPGAPDGGLDGILYLKGQHVIESEVFDDVTRIASTTGVLRCDNHFGDYTGSYGNVALDLSASRGGPFFRRMFGMAGCGPQGIKFSRKDPNRLMELPFCDFSAMMQVALNDDLVADQWCLFGLVWYLCQKANIHPYWLQYIPYYRPGKAGYDCPYPILASGSGNHPKYHYGAEMSCWSILAQLVLDQSIIDPISGLPVPFYMGFDFNGFFHFEPVALYRNALTITYSDYDATGWGSIYDIEVYNSVQDMRTELNFQGLDAETYELLYYHLPLPPWVAVAKGYRDTWTERNARFASLEYLMYVAQVAAIQASIPQQTVVLKVPFRPHVHAGDLCVISERYALGRTGVFSIKSLRNVWGINLDGTQDSYSIVVARAIENSY